MGECAHLAGRTTGPTLGADRGDRWLTVLDEYDELLLNERNDLVDRFHGLACLMFGASQWQSFNAGH
jgi:hypothetical protein